MGWFQLPTLGDPLIARTGSLKFRLALLGFALAAGAGAQTYRIDSGSTENKQIQGSRPEPSSPPLGWGSNIQNARLARAAQLALKNGNHALALDLAQRAAQASPNDPQLWFLLGYAARLNARYPMSVDAYERGLHLNPSSLDGLSGLAQDYSVMGRNEEAERLLRQVVSSDPSRGNDDLLLGDLYMRLRNFSDAVDWLLKSEKAHPNPRSELLLALSYQQLKQTDLSKQYLGLAERHAPNNPEVARSMAGYYRESGNYSEAIKALKAIRRPSPDVTAELAYTFQLDGRLDESAQLYATAANSLPKDVSLQLSAAQAEVATGSIDRATSFLGRAAKIDENNYRFHAISAEIAQFQENNDEAIKDYKAALANLPSLPVEGALFRIQLHLDLMTLYRSTGDDSSAKSELKKATEEIGETDGSGNGRPAFLRLRALIKLNSGDYDSALTDVREALKVNPENRDNLQLDGDILMKQGNIENAIVAYKRVLGTDPQNPFALTSLGYASRAVGRDKEAEKCFERLLQAYPSNYVPHLALGDLYTARRDFEKAEAAYRSAFALAPHNALIVAGGMNEAIETHNLQLAGEWSKRITAGMRREPQILREQERYLSFEGRYEESATVAREAIKALPHDRDVAVYLGYDLLHLGEYDELLQLTSKYMEILPNEPDIPLLQGYVHKHQGLSDKAREDFTEALTRDPNVVTAYVNRGYMLNDLHKPLPAAADFEAAIQRSPEDGEAHLGLAYASLDLSKPEAALRQSQLAEKVMGNSRDVHMIRATAYGQEEMLSKAVGEYRDALVFTPNDGALHLGLGNALFSERHYHDAIEELELADKTSSDNANIAAMLARSYAALGERAKAIDSVELAEKRVQNASLENQSKVFISTGEALSALGDQNGAMSRFTKALETPQSDRVGVRLAIARVMADQGRAEDANRQIVLAWMEAAAGDTAPPNGNQFIAAADVIRSTHDYDLSQTYLERAKSAGAPDAKIRIGMANNYLARGDTTRAQAELAAVNASSDSAPDYQYLLAEANVFRQEHEGAQALTSFAQASDAEGEDQVAEQGMLEAGADEGLRVTPRVSLLSDFSMEPVFEDSTVYVLDSKLDASFSVPPSDTALLPPPRSTLQTQWTDSFHLHFGHLPTPSGFFQVRNARGDISVPATNSIVSRDTTDYTFNFGLNPIVRLGRNVLIFNGGMQETVRRDSLSPTQMNQNLFRIFMYMSTSTFFNALSVSGYVIRESGPFTDLNLHSSALTGAIDFRVGAPWGKTALVTGWGSCDQSFSPVRYEDYYSSAYMGIEQRFSSRLNVRAVVEDLRAWRIVGANSGVAQNLRPAGVVNFKPGLNWDLQFSGAFSNTRSFHVYDSIQSGFSVSYARPFGRKFNNDSQSLVLKYPIRFTAGVMDETFPNFEGARNQQLKPYVQITVF